MTFFFCSHAPVSRTEIGRLGSFFRWVRALIDDINRDYPFQVKLSLEDELKPVGWVRREAA